MDLSRKAVPPRTPELCVRGLQPRGASGAFPVRVAEPQGTFSCLHLRVIPHAVVLPGLQDPRITIEATR